MPPLRPFDLSSFGLTAPSTSSRVDETLAQEPNALEQLIGKPSQIMDETAKARLLEQMLGQVEAAPQPTALDNLLSGRGLISLLGTAAAGALGGAPAAAGFGLGSLQGAQAAAEAQRSQNMAAREDLQARLEKAQDQLDKSRTRVATLFNTNPDAFVDPTTGKQVVSPEVLGFYITGDQIPLFATTRRTMERREKQWEARNELLTSRLETATSDHDAENILKAIFINQNYKAPPELISTLARARKDPNAMTSEAFNAIMRYSAGGSGLDAAIFAGENKLSPWDPRVLRMVEWKDPDADMGKMTPSDRFLELADEINAWQADPANLDRIRELRKETAGKGEGAFSLAIASEVLGGRRGDFDTYVHEANVRGPDELNALMQNYRFVTDKYQLGIGMSGLDKTSTIANMSEPERQAWLWGKAEEERQAQIQQAAKAQEKQDAGLANGVAQELQKSLKIGARAANAAAKDIMKIALDRSTRPDGRVDRVRFEMEVKKVTQEAIAGAATE